MSASDKPKAKTVKRIIYFKRWTDPVAEKILGSRADIEVTRLELDGNCEKNWAAMQDAHGYQCLPRFEMGKAWFPNAQLIARCPNLLAVSSSGAGHDVVDVDACTAAGVIVCNQAGTNKEAVAEHALGFMLSLSKKIALGDRVTRRGAVVDRWDLKSNDIRSKILGIVGIGHIGGRLAKICRDAFDMTILAVDPYLTAEEVSSRDGIKVQMAELLAKSDFVSINCPLTPETKGMFGKAQFSAMKRTAFFITTARGGIHDEQALAEILASKGIAGAGLDVFSVEPPSPDHPLLAFDNVIATPHLAGITDEATRNGATAAAEQWMTIWDGGVPPRLVNPEVWPRYSQRFETTFGFRPVQLKE